MNDAEAVDDDDYYFSVPSLFGPVRAAYAYHEEDCELEIAWRAKVIKLLGLRRIIESKEEDREEFKRTCLGGPNEDWVEPRLGVSIVAEKLPYSDYETRIDCPYWEHEGKIF